jgi:RNA polymerase sigma factor (sigma-70 family)
MVQPTPDEECQALRTMQRGDMAGWQQLHEWHASRLCKTVAYQGLAPQFAEEVAQETFIKIWNRANDLDCQPRGMFPWLKQAAKNLAIDIQRRSRTVVVLHATDELPEAVDDTVALNALLDAENKAMIDQVLAMIEDRNPKMALVIRFRMLDGLNPTETAERMGITANHVNQLLYRGLKQFKDRWPPR